MTCLSRICIALVLVLACTIATYNARADCGGVWIDPGDNSGQDNSQQQGSDGWPDENGGQQQGSDGWPDQNDGQQQGSDGWPDENGGQQQGSDGWPDENGGQQQGSDGWPDENDGQQQGSDGPSGGESGADDWHGGIPISKPVMLEEPTQNAVIAWNQREEIFVLSTELKAARKGKFLEIMPLPSRPTVTKGDAELFQKTLDLFHEKQGQRVAVPGPRLARRGPGGEVVEEVKIGYHHITVARVLDQKEFVRWAEGFAKARAGRSAKPVFTSVGKQVISKYLQEGYRYWVFDLIEPDTTLQPHVAIQFRFATNSLYYPLKITRSSGVGNTRVQLLVLTDQLLGYFRGLERERIKAPGSAVAVSPQELRGLSPDIASLFGDRPVKLRLWELEGPIQSFTTDLHAAAAPAQQAPLQQAPLQRMPLQQAPLQRIPLDRTSGVRVPVIPPRQFLPRPF